MSHPDNDMPKRLRDGEASDFEERILSAGWAEEPSSELSARMAAAVDLASVPLLPPPPTAVLGKTALLRVSTWTWLAAGVAALSGSAYLALRPVFSPKPQVPVPSVEIQPPPTAEATPAVAPTEPAGQTNTVTAPPAPPAAPTPSKRPPASVTGSDFSAQIALIDAARAAVAAKEDARAMELLRRYESRFPAGSFRPEAEAITIEALVHLGKLAEARALAKRFLAEHRRGLLSDRVARLVSGDRH